MLHLPQCWQLDSYLPVVINFHFPLPVTFWCVAMAETTWERWSRRMMVFMLLDFHRGVVDHCSFQLVGVQRIFFDLIGSENMHATWQPDQNRARPFVWGRPLRRWCAMLPAGGCWLSPPGRLWKCQYLSSPTMQRAVGLAACARAGSENSKMLCLLIFTLQVNTADNNEITETTENSEESSKKVSEDGRLGNRLSD